MAQFPVVLSLVDPSLAVVPKKLEAQIDGMFEHIRVGHIRGQVWWLAPQVDHVLPTYALVRPPGRSCLWVPVHWVVAGLLVT